MTDQFSLVTPNCKLDLSYLPSRETWKENISRGYLTEIEPDDFDFSLDYVQEYRLVYPKATMMPSCCFSCFQGGEDDDKIPVYAQTIDSDQCDRDNYPWTMSHHCGREYCKTSAEISTQLYMAMFQRFMPDLKSPLLKNNNLSIRRSNGDIESGWRFISYMIYTKDPTKILVSVINDKKQLRKGVYFEEFMELNPELKEQARPVFNPWYPKEVQNKIMNLLSSFYPPS